MKRVLSILVLLLTVSYTYSQNAVDLGLSVKWGDRNLGAPNPYKPGEYISWGEISEKQASRYTEDNYTCKLDIKKDNSIKGSKTYDAAANRLGGYWRMPTPEECRELFRNCTLNLIYDKKLNIHYWEIIGPNGNKIIIPIAGHKHDGGLVAYDKDTEFWTTRYNDDDEWGGHAFSAQLSPTFFGAPWRVQGEATYVGLNIRPVYDTVKEMEKSDNPIIRKIGFANRCEKMAYESPYSNYQFSYFRQAVEVYEEVKNLAGYENYISENEIDNIISQIYENMKSISSAGFEQYIAEKRKKASDWTYGTASFKGNKPSTSMTVGTVRIWYSGSLRKTGTEGDVDIWEGTGDICVVFPKNYNGRQMRFISTGGTVQIQTLK